MTATNHGVTGALVAAAISHPAIGLPLALISHFGADMLPHWDYYSRVKRPADRKYYGALDFFLALMILGAIALTVDASAWLILIGGFLAISPDFMWLRFILKGKTSVTSNRKTLMSRIRQFHHRIQWLETKKIVGLYAEIAWFVLMIWLIYQIHR